MPLTLLTKLSETKPSSGAQLAELSLPDTRSDNLLHAGEDVKEFGARTGAVSCKSVVPLGPATQPRGVTTPGRPLSNLVN